MPDQFGGLSTTLDSQHAMPVLTGAQIGLPDITATRPQGPTVSGQEATPWEIAAKAGDYWALNSAAAPTLRALAVTNGPHDPTDPNDPYFGTKEWIEVHGNGPGSIKPPVWDDSLRMWAENTHEVAPNNYQPQVVTLTQADSDTQLKKLSSDLGQPDPDAQQLELYWKTLRSGANTLSTIRHQMTHTDQQRQILRDEFTRMGLSTSDNDLSAAQDQLDSLSLAQLQWNKAHSAAEQENIKTIYRQKLGREADAGGISAYQDYVGMTGSLQAAATDVAHSTEARSVLQRTLSGMGLNTSDGDLSQAQDQLATSTLNQLRWDKAHSAAEQENIKFLFRQELGREADSGGVQTYQDLVGRTGSIQDVRTALANSGEGHGVISSIIPSVQNRFANGADEPWIRAQQDFLGRGGNLATIRNTLIDDRSENGVIDQIYPRLHGRPAGQADYDYAREQMHTGLSIQQYVWNEAHTQDAANLLAASIHDIQGRNADPRDAAWIRARQDDLGNQRVSQQDIREQMVDFAGEATVIATRVMAIHNRAAVQADYDYARWRMHTGWTIQQYTNDEAHTPQVRVSLNALQQSVVGTGAGHEFQAWNDWAMDAMGQPEWCRP